MTDDERADRLEALVSEADSLVSALRDPDDATERTQETVHRLREVLGVALVLAEGVARDAGDGSMLTLETSDGSGEVRYRVILDESEIAELNPS